MPKLIVCIVSLEIIQVLKSLPHLPDRHFIKRINVVINDNIFVSNAHMQRMLIACAQVSIDNVT